MPSQNKKLAHNTTFQGQEQIQADHFCTWHGCGLVVKKETGDFSQEEFRRRIHSFMPLPLHNTFYWIFLFADFFSGNL
jgi:hypothetical protein